MKVSVYTPIRNEVDFVGYMIMAVLPHVHEILLGCAPSDDGTDELVDHIQAKYALGKLRIIREPVHAWSRGDQKGYEASYNDLINRATGDAIWYLHADMICTNPEKIAEIPEGPLAWWTNIRSFAGRMDNEIIVGRAKRWKNVHVKDFGLHYAGAYGSQNEDMYFRDITGTTYKHHDEEFEKYPFEISDSGLNVNHYCEMKPYAERLRKMKTCLKAQNPFADEAWISERAANHPRVTLESGVSRYGVFEFSKSTDPLPTVFDRYGKEFESFKRRLAHV